MTVDEGQQGREKEAFILLMRMLHNALRHLYNPIELRQSPLIALFSLEQHAHPTSELRSLLLEAISWLKPAGQTPRHAKSWRAYQILRQRYQEQFTQQEVASDIGLSIRHLRREERWAVRLLAEELWAKYQLADKWSQFPPEQTHQLESITPPAHPTPDWTTEIIRLNESSSQEPVDLVELLQVVAQLVVPLLESTSVQLKITAPDERLWVNAQSATMRHALLNILSAMISVAPGGQLLLTASSHEQTAQIDIAVAPPAAVAGNRSSLNEMALESLAIARQLCELSAAVLTMTQPKSPECPLAVQVRLPRIERIAILMIEDNQDTIQLVQRYLLHSRYRLIGVSDSEQALAVAEKQNPQIIVLDVMLPGVDGWELLGRLRQHPTTYNVPVIVCSILPQESLALALGASVFLRKPFTQQALLSHLDRLSGSTEPESR